MNLKLRKWLACTMVGVLSVGLCPNISYAQENKVTQELQVDIDLSNYNGAQIEDAGITVPVNNVAGVYPSVYDLRAMGLVSKRVEDQGRSSNCWAFASAAAMESNIIKKGYDNANINLSENHIAYFLYNRVKDPVGYTEGDVNIPANVWYDNGGTMQGTALFLATWAGPVKETVSEDNPDGSYKLNNWLDDSQCYRSDFRVANSYYFDYDVNTIKRAVTQYGAVAMGYFYDQICYSTEDGVSYYSPVASNNHASLHPGVGGHAVTIVGWDDNYDRNNFQSSYRPSGNGAWIIKNSYGSSFADGGYMYISYEDKSISDIVAYDMARVSDSYHNNYQYDGSAVSGLYYYVPNGTRISNVFRAKSGKYNEDLKAVSICTYSSNVNYQLEIYTGLTGSSPTSGVMVHKQSGSMANAGYNQIKLSKPVAIPAKEKYAVVFKLNAPNGGAVKMALDASVNAGGILFRNEVKAGQSFVKKGKKWYDLGKESGASLMPVYIDDNNGHMVKAGYSYTNVRIKAYTNKTNVVTKFKLNNKTLGVSKGSASKLSLVCTPSSVKRKITWSSSNKKVATVSSAGKVKGKSIGTATIKAKFVSGKGSKTLQCKVTVGPSKPKNLKVKAGKKKVTVSWKKSSGASGYEICYATSKDGKYKKLTEVTSGKKTKVSKKLKKGTFYVKVRPYVKKDGKKLYGSYTSPKKVNVK